ncbi:hypothetical protein GGQ96_004193 [Sphingomonas abaci]|uniref:Uncharacterized protein n=1 Tax=Sphingomonas abaci TaxID=237611 RepID=A0A7W7AMX5_9SPHN|nr:hypothetical protein [Sphingomonas abaci]
MGRAAAKRLQRFFGQEVVEMGDMLFVLTLVVYKRPHGM